MARLEVDVKQIQKLIKKRVTKAQKTINVFEGQAEKYVKEWVKYGFKTHKEGKKQFDRIVKDVRKTVQKSPLVKNFQKTNAFSVALLAKDEIEKRVGETQEKVFEFLNVPTKNDIDKLDKKVDTLTKQLKQKTKSLKKRKK